VNRSAARSALVLRVFGFPLDRLAGLLGVFQSLKGLPLFFLLAELFLVIGPRPWSQALLAESAKPSSVITSILARRRVSSELDSCAS
jgi:hypothetical protein